MRSRPALGAGLFGLNVSEKLVRIRPGINHAMRCHSHALRATTHGVAATPVRCSSGAYAAGRTTLGLQCIQC